jgi:hypothetical protein
MSRPAGSSPPSTALSTKGCRGLAGGGLASCALMRAEQPRFFFVVFESTSYWRTVLDSSIQSAVCIPCSCMQLKKLFRAQRRKVSVCKPAKRQARSPWAKWASGPCATAAETDFRDSSASIHPLFLYAVKETFPSSARRCLFVQACRMAGAQPLGEVGFLPLHGRSRKSVSAAVRACIHTLF